MKHRNRLVGEEPKQDPREKFEKGIVIFVLILLSIVGLVTVLRFIGWAALQGMAGTIYEVEFVIKKPSQHWAGVYGVSARLPGYTNIQYLDLCPSSMSEINLVFDCLLRDDENEVYATTKNPTTIDWNSVVPATAAEIDAYQGIDSSYLEAGSNTFTKTMVVKLGTRSILVPAAYTYDSSGNQDLFNVGVLKDPSDGTLIFVSKLVNLTEGFNGRLYNYQMILPLPGNASGNATCVRYYFYTDPFNTCPAGEGEAYQFGQVYGYVTTLEGTPLENVLVTVAGFGALTQANGFYNITAPVGTQDIFAVKTGYKVYHNTVNITAGNATQHNIILEPEEIQAIGPGQDQPGTGQGTTNARGQGPGQAPLVPVIEQPKIVEGKDFIVTVSEIKRKIRKDEFIQEVVRVFSFKKNMLTLHLETSGNVTEIMTIDKDLLVISPKGQDSFVVTIFGKGNVGDIYTGNITLKELNVTIPVEIEILSKEKLPVEALSMRVSMIDSKVKPNSKAKFKVDLQNLLSDMSYPVRLVYVVQKIGSNETIWSDASNFVIKTSLSILRDFKVPDNVQEGDYVLKVTAYYLGLSATVSSHFVVYIPFYARQLFGPVKVWHVLLVLFIIALGVAGFVIYKRIEESKKKYHLKVDYKELPKPGPRSIYVGKIAETDHKVYFDLEQFKIHGIVAGTTGGGKTVAAQVIVEEALMKGVAVIVFDPTAQWSGFLRKQEDKGMLRLYPLFGMKPQQARAFNGNVRMVTDPYEVIEIKKYMKPGEIQIFTLNKLEPKDIDIFVANVIREVFREGFDESRELRLLLVFDEVHRLLPKFGGSGEGFVQIERGAREFRKWGIGLLLVSQVLSDFVGQIKANINTEIQMRTRDEGDLKRVATKYGDEVLKSLVKASVGTGLVQNAAWNRGRPFFVTFRPLLHNVTRLSDEELEKYNKYNEIIDQIEYELQQLEEKGQDVFDLKLELKLALDKLKSGNFNIVDVYLDDIKPRLKKMWDKIGEKPKKLEKKRVSAEELKKAIEQAQKERKEIESQEASQEKAKEEGQKTAFDVNVQFKDALNFENGISIISLQEIIDALPTVPAQIFVQHVNDQKNEVAEWVKKHFSKKLGEELMDKRKKDEIVSVVQQALEKKKDYPYDPEQGQEQKEEKKEESKEEGEEAKGVGKQKESERDKEESKEVKGEEKSEKKSKEIGENSNEVVVASGNRALVMIKEIKAPAGKEFVLANGYKISSLNELVSQLKIMPREIFEQHVTSDRNDFANWIRYVFKFEDLAEKVQGISNNQEMAKAIEEYLENLSKNGEG